MYVYGKSGVIFSGRLTKDPERKSGKYGDFMQINISCTTGKRQDGEKYAPSIIIGTTVPSASESACARLRKGDVVQVSCMSIDSSEGKDGKKWYNATAEVISFEAAVIERLCMQAAGAAAAAVTPEAEPEMLGGEDEHLPF